MRFGSPDEKIDVDPIDMDLINVDLTDLMEEPRYALPDYSTETYLTLCSSEGFTTDNAIDLMYFVFEHADNRGWLGAKTAKTNEVIRRTRQTLKESINTSFYDKTGLQSIDVPAATRIITDYKPLIRFTTLAVNLDNKSLNLATRMKLWWSGVYPMHHPWNEFHPMYDAIKLYWLNWFSQFKDVSVFKQFESIVRSDDRSLSKQLAQAEQNSRMRPLDDTKDLQMLQQRRNFFLYMWRRSENIFCYYRTLFYECDTPYLGSAIPSSHCPFGRPYDYDIVPIYKDLMDHYESKVRYRNKAWKTDNQKINDQIKTLQKDAAQEREKIASLEGSVAEYRKLMSEVRTTKKGQQIAGPVQQVKRV